MTDQIFSVRDVLGDQGLIARRLAAYESRTEQLDMAEAVYDAIRRRKHLIAEAGTGVGKSFAYLVPAILAAQHASMSEDKKHRVIISTHTISLQEQLIQQDIPFLQAVLPAEFSAVLVKGRGNYISLRRLAKARERSSQRTMFDGDGQRSLSQILAWSQKTTDGSRADMSFRPQPEVWDDVVSDHGDCLGKKCPSHNDCFYYKARRRVWNADVLIVNHALFFSDLSLRRDGASILPDYDTVIFDEAHTIESVAADHLGFSISEGQVDYLLNKLYNDRSQRGILIVHKLNDAQQQVRRVQHHAQTYFYAVDDWSRRFSRSNGRLDRPVDIPNDLTAELRKLGQMILLASERMVNEGDQVELASAGNRCMMMAETIAAWAQQRTADSVYWVDRSGTTKQRITLMSAPVEVGAILRDQLFNEVPSVILASATLATGSKDFRFFRSRIGLTDGNDIRLGSPFDYRHQARLILSSGMPDPATHAKAFEQECCRRMQRHLKETNGRAFVLFTSYSMMQFCAERLAGWFADNDMTLYCQGRGLQRSAMLDRFRNDPRAVLFGTDSFWQGVNVPGDALQNVIIPRLPFSVPDHPLLEARLEKIRERGGNPFQEYQIPEAVIKLKQGFGRLIRHREDSGRVVILDPRVLTKPYGRLFIQSLPDCRIEIDNGESIDPMPMDD